MPSSSAAPIHPCILALDVRGGYFDALHISFAPHMTCIFGGKGSGKTTLFEMLRFALFGSMLARGDTVRSLLRKNLGTGVVRVTFQTRHGVRYVAERGLKDERPRFFSEEGAPAKLAPDAFPIEVYGQDEIESVGGDRASQLALLDRLAGDELSPLLAEIAAVTERMERGAEALLTLEGEIAGLESDASEARAIEEQLKPLLAATGADAEILKTAHAAKGVRGRERQTLIAALAALAAVRTDAETFAALARKKLGGVVPPELRESPNADLFLRLEQDLASVAGAFEVLVTGGLQRIDGASKSLTDIQAKLAALHAKDDGAYDALLSRQKEDHIKTGERARLQERHAVVAAAIPLLEERMRRHAELRREQDVLAARLVELRDLSGAVRKRLEATVNAALEAQGVRVQVRQAMQLEAYRAYLREPFKTITSDQPKWLVERVSRIRPEDLVAIVRTQDVELLLQKADLKTAERAAQVIGVLTPNKHLYALQAIPIDDEAVISVKHGEEWKDTVECSPGQRCGAILPILLLQGDTPLLIDQPDDNVEPDFMCNVILPRVGALRGARQFVFVTHHANVPVIARAEEVVFITSNGRSAQRHAHGGVRVMKEWILSKLEGGEAAFATRRRLYEGPADGPGAEE
jgi:hypothetical protein